ncbi:uncharacterized protein LOC113272740 [Papaver somniferum]|uniref:uncharacterized protein LOC113272740 n=1 Tax=Papaver somniferum TaxID=3469 RepID=UPI000E6FAE7B|nr:uncharacterized protein LOC113272740 [Papaver somniferum]
MTTKEKLQEIQNIVAQHTDAITEMKNEIQSLGDKMNLLINLFQSTQSHQPEASGSENHPPNPGNPFTNLHQVIHNFSNTESRKFTRTPKVDLPRFNGINPRGWALKCDRYFSLHKFPEDERVDMAAIHFDSAVDSWFLNYQHGKEFISWVKHDLCARFEDVAQDNYVGSVNKLVQTFTVEDYYDLWEHYKSFMIANNPYLPESFYTLSFISGLKEEIRTVVQMFKPENTATTFYLARLQQAYLHHQPKPTKSFSEPFVPSPLSVSHPPYTVKSFFSPSSTLTKHNTSSSPPIVTHPTTPTRTSSDNYFPPVKRLTHSQMQVRKDKRICYNCDEFYRKGHRCKTQQLFMLIVDEDLERQESLSTEDVSKDSPSTPDYPIEISLHALTGNVAPDTIRIVGHLNKHYVSVLIDTGSTHSFIDAVLTSKLGLHVSPTGRMLVTVANGDRIISQGICHNLHWDMQGHQFSANLRTFPLGGCDIVLGADWLRQLGDVTFNFSQLSISFRHQGSHITLQGTTSKPSLSMISGSSLNKFIKSNTPTLIGQFFSISTTPILPPPPAVSALLETFVDVFAEPTGLPPSRSLDHKIPLKHGSNPTSQRPYKCPYIHKSFVESLVSEMLSSGVIQHSHNPFAAPILLVKKKDGIWRFCVDYRKLNDITVKDKYPIPLIEELLDELNGSVVFSKIDLRSGYYQIRVYAPDIHKTAFRTHQGHYEFRVMPFGLTNTPATFQALMNEVFQPYLRKFVLVFFDNILVYSPSMEEHLEHLQLTLSLLRKHSLSSKLSKCAFAQPQLEYLGHIITTNGVASDPDKVATMVNWPKPQTLKQLRGFLGLIGYYENSLRGMETSVSHSRYD